MQGGMQGGRGEGGGGKEGAGLFLTTFKLFGMCVVSPWHEGGEREGQTPKGDQKIQTDTQKNLPYSQNFSFFSLFPY